MEGTLSTEIAENCNRSNPGYHVPGAQIVSKQRKIFSNLTAGSYTKGSWIYNKMIKFQSLVFGECSRENGLKAVTGS